MDWWKLLDAGIGFVIIMKYKEERKMVETQKYYQKISEIQEHYQQNHHQSISFYEAMAIFLSAIALEENDQIMNWTEKYQNWGD